MNTLPKLVRWLVLLIVLTAGLSLLYGLQHRVDGPLELTTVNEISDLALSPQGSPLAAGAQDGMVYLWDVDVQGDWPVRKLSGHTDAIVRVAFAPSGATLFSASRDGTVRLWNVAGGQVEKVLEAPDGKPIKDASLSADGSTLATLAEGGDIRVWDVAEGEVLQSISHENARHAVALSADGALVATDDGENVQIWDARTGEPVQKLQGHWEDETQDDWMGHKEEVCQKIILPKLCQLNRVTALAFSPDGEMLASGAADKIIAFWMLETGRVRWISKGHFGAITKLIFNAEGDALISGSRDKKAKVWRVAGGKVTSTFVGHLSSVNGVAFSTDPQAVFSAGSDGSVRAWNVVNTTETRIEWTVKGLQSTWNGLFGSWLLVSGLLGLICAWGLYKLHGWSHLLALALYILGPIVVLGLPLLEVTSYPFTRGLQIQIAWPLIVLAVWYAALVAMLMRETVTTPYEAPQDLPLAEQYMSIVRIRRLRKSLFVGAVWVLLLVILYSVLRRFDLDTAFMGHFFSFIMDGAGLTLRVSAFSIALAVVLALLGALGRLSDNPIANGVSGFYISLIRGTPLLVQIYIWYLGLPRLGIILEAEQAGVLALGVNYGAYMTEIFRAGIQAIGIGQHEAAYAVGMTRTQTLSRIVLPQAFRIVIPPIGNEFIAMMKDSSLVSIMSFWELTFRAGKIGRQYFRSMETFIVAAAFYWLLTVIFQFLQGRLEEYMARGERR